MARINFDNNMVGADIRQLINDNFIELYNKLIATNIKTTYESNTNTNAFTDADKTKLDDIDGQTLHTHANKAELDTINQNLSITSDVTFNSINVTQGIKVKEKVITETNDIILDDESTTVLLDTNLNDVNVILPQIDGKRYYLKKISASNVVNVSVANSGLIEGQSSLSLNNQYESLTVVSNGTNYYIV